MNRCHLDVLQNIIAINSIIVWLFIISAFGPNFTPAYILHTQDQLKCIELKTTVWFLPPPPPDPQYVKKNYGGKIYRWLVNATRLYRIMNINTSNVTTLESFL